jgi:hypothetical protein
VRYGGMMALLIAGVLACGCSVQQLPPTAMQMPQAPARPLPFKGRLVQGDPTELPPDVAMSLSKSSPITFMYREQLTHDERHASMLATALAPSTYAGAALGEYGVDAFAELTILDGNRIIGDYTAKARVWKSYSLYSTPTHAELERAARAAVRGKIDAQLERDARHLAQAVNPSPSAPAVQTGQ